MTETSLQHARSLSPDGSSLAQAPALIVREKEPLNLEFPFSALNDFITPAESFYIRSHFPVPRLDTGSYQLRIDGAIEHPLTISYDELRRMPAQTNPFTLECAGNSRVFLTPQKQGVQWERGAIGTANWTGVPLASILDLVRPTNRAIEIVLEGADRGEPSKAPKPSGSIPFARSLPLSKARQPEVMLAYQMNGAELPPEHGFPVRAVVPGHYGMASVKWLTAIHVIEERFEGYWQTTDYAYWDYVSGAPVRRPLRDLMVKSLIARPSLYEHVPAASNYEITGAAWSGASTITEVELSTDAGGTWALVEFLDPIHPFAWRRWRYEWHTPDRACSCTLMSRARDGSGVTQPEKHDPKYEAYAIHHTLPVDVFVDER